jgi:hypothetical protein
MRSVLIIVLFVQVIAAMSRGKFIQEAPVYAHATVFFFYEFFLPSSLIIVPVVTVDDDWKTTKSIIFYGS